MTIPWVSMPTRPRSTIRTIIDVRPKYGIVYLAAAYAIQSLFFAANYWSWGLHTSWKIIVPAIAMASPLLALIWLTYMGWLFQITGRWLGGRGKRSHLSCAIAWSKLPVLLLVPIWIFFISLNPTRAFILGAGDPSPILIHCISLALGTWSQILRIQSIREVQGFSFLRSLTNVAIAWVFSVISFFFLFSVLRFISVNY